MGGASGGSGSGSDGKDGDRISRSLLLSSVSSSLSGSNGTPCVYMYMYVQGFLLVKGGGLSGLPGEEGRQTFYAYNDPYQRLTSPCPQLCFQLKAWNGPGVSAHGCLPGTLRYIHVATTQVILS